MFSNTNKEIKVNLGEAFTRSSSKKQWKCIFAIKHIRQFAAQFSLNISESACLIVYRDPIKQVFK